MIGISQESILSNTMQGIKDLLHGGLTHRNMKEYRMTYVINAQDSLDADYDMIVPFNIPPELTRMIRTTVTFWILPFRAYSKATANNTQQTSGDGGSVSTTSGTGGAANLTSADGGAATLTSADGGSTTPTSSNTSTPSGGGHTTASGGGHTSGASSTSTTAAGGQRNLTSGTNGCTFNSGSSKTHGHGISGETHWKCLHSHAVAQADHTHGMSHTHTVSNHQHTVSDHTHPNHNHTVTIESHTHGVTLADHAHGVTLANHTHSVTIGTHTHTVAAHGHDITFGIYEETNSPSVALAVSRDNGITWSNFVGTYTENQVNLEISSLVDTPGAKLLKFTSTARARLAAQIEVKLDVSR